MKERRDFIKAVAVSAGAIALPGVAHAQITGALVPSVTMLLNEEQFVIPAAASASVEISIAEAPP